MYRGNQIGQQALIAIVLFEIAVLCLVKCIVD